MGKATSITATDTHPPAITYCRGGSPATEPCPATRVNQSSSRGRNGAMLVAALMTAVCELVPKVL